MDIRSFDLNDADDVISLWHAAGLTRPWNDPRLDIERKLRVQPELFLVASDAPGSASIMGTVMAGYDGHRGWIHYLAVAATHRDRGVGRALVLSAEQRLAAMGCPRVQLQVRPDNEQVLPFYERLGYGIYGTHSLSKPLPSRSRKAGRLAGTGPQPENRA